eukprot:5615902-Prymnesium_polylepis.1
MNFGVEARDGEQGFDSATGAGAVRAQNAVYHDVLFSKGNTLVLTLHSLWGGLAPGAAWPTCIPSGPARAHA